MIKGLPNHHSVIGNHDNFHNGSGDGDYKTMVYSNGKVTVVGICRGTSRVIEIN